MSFFYKLIQQKVSPVFGVLALVLSFYAFSAHAYTSAHGLFNSAEVASHNLKIFPKWQRVLHTIPQDIRESAQPCHGSGDQCRLQNWQAFLQGIQHISPIEKAVAVNSYINQVAYIQDNDNWQRSDYWASLSEFFNRNGDCEDFAIAKFVSLRLLGIPNEAMRVVVVKDMQKNVTHAVLALRLEGQDLILDNQAENVANAQQISHYKPIYSVNEDTWWLHK